MQHKKQAGQVKDLLDEDLPQAALSKGVVLQIEAVKAVEGLFASVHVQSVHIQVIPTWSVPHCLCCIGVPQHRGSDKSHLMR